MKAFLLILLLLFNSILPTNLDEFEPEGKNWELVVIFWDYESSEEITLSYYFKDYYSMKTKMDFIYKTHRPKGSIKRLLYREINKRPISSFIVVVVK